jgi:hypothetical protein
MLQALKFNNKNQKNEEIKDCVGSTLGHKKGAFLLDLSNYENGLISLHPSLSYESSASFGEN